MLAPAYGSPAGCSAPTPVSEECAQLWLQSNFELFTGMTTLRPPPESSTVVWKGFNKGCGRAEHFKGEVLQVEDATDERHDFYVLVRGC